MKKLHADVAIVGAGPAGSMAAHNLASAGARVVLLERASFPRDKPCGDGVSNRGLMMLERMGLGEWTSQFLAPQVMRISSPGGGVLDVRSPQASGSCYGRTIPRHLLDARIARAATEAGARLVEGARVRAIETSQGTNSSQLSIVADGLKVDAQLVILADGSHAPITRRLGLVQELPELVAIRQYFVGDAGPIDRLEIHFQPKEIMPGYTWLFPVGNGRVNVGTGTLTRRTRRGEVSLQNVLAHFVTDPRITPSGYWWLAMPLGW